MSMEIQFNRIGNYAEYGELGRFVLEVKQLLKQIEKPPEGEVAFQSLKLVCEKLKIKVHEAFEFHQEQFEEAKRDVEGKRENASLAQCKRLKMNQLMMKELRVLADNAKHVDYSIQRVDGFPDER